MFSDVQSILPILRQGGFQLLLRLQPLDASCQNLTVYLLEAEFPASCEANHHKHWVWRHGKKVVRMMVTDPVDHPVDSTTPIIAGPESVPAESPVPKVIGEVRCCCLFMLIGAFRLPIRLWWKLQLMLSRQRWWPH